MNNREISSLRKQRKHKQLLIRLGIFEFGQFQEARTAPVLAAMDFAVNQQRQSFFR